MAPKPKQAARRAAGKAKAVARRIPVEAQNAINGDLMATVEVTQSETTQNILHYLCTLCGVDSDEHALLYENERIDLKNVTLKDLVVISAASMQILKTKKKIRMLLR